MRRIFLLLFLSISCFAKTKGELHALFCSLDPFSVAQNFAFYELYPESIEGKKAFQRAWKLLNQNASTTFDVSLPKIDLRAIISLVNKENFEAPQLTSAQLTFIDKLAKHLPNRKLKGYHIWDENKILALPPEEIDVCRALFLAQDDTTKAQVSQYEATIDLMALQILARLPHKATPKEKIEAINQFIFYEMHFRFPPHSLWAKDVDVYTFLPSVIDSRKGVCLGVSILYICLAQRLDLPLEIITPPGHIYVRYRDAEGQIINIETTARGINPPSDVYLGIETKSLQRRNLKQLVGLAFINQASVSWMREDYNIAVHLYEKALKYLPNDPQLKEFLGLNYLFVDKIEKGECLLKEIRNVTFEYAITKDTLAEDYLSGLVDVQGLKTIFLSVDQTRASILAKRKALEKTLKKHPRFRAALFQLAGTWLQLGREKEAKKILEKYQQIDENEPTVNYYLCVICAQRFNYPKAWHYYKKTEKILSEHKHFPKAMKDLKLALMQLCPQQ